MKQNEDYYLHQVKNSLDRGTNFVEYFLSIGLPNSMIFDPFLYENDLKTLNSSEKITPRILSKFPEFDKTSIIVDSSIIKYIFPHGYSLVESPSTPPNSEFTFTLDNDHYYLNHEKKYVSCLVFYEPLETYHKLYSKYSERNSAKSAFSSFSDLPTAKMSCLTESESSSISNSGPYKTSVPFTLPTEKMSSVSPVLTSTLSGDDFESKSQRMSEIFYLKGKDKHNSLKLNLSKVYAPKCICLVSLYPFFNETSRILKSILRYSRKKKIKKPIELVIQNLVLEVPCPPRGIWQVEYLINSEKYELRQPRMNSLPLLNLSTEKLIECFKFEKIVEIYKYVLLEIRMFFFSKNIANLNIFIETFLNFIYPLRYSKNVIPILPLELYSLIDGETPYMLGINQTYSKSFFDQHGLDMQDYNYVVIDIDTGIVEQFNESTTKITFGLTERQISDEIPDLPRHYKIKFTDVLKAFLRELKEMKTSESKESFCNRFRQIFFNFLVSILQDYSNFVDFSAREKILMNPNFNVKDINTLFRVDEFLNSQNVLDKPFYKNFFETGMFYDFVYRVLFPKNVKDKLEILYFDESIKEKNGRKIFAKKSETPFLKTSIYHYRKRHIVEARSHVEKSEISTILENQYFEKSKKYGQEILIEKNDIFFQYSLFPKLLFKVFFSPMKKNYSIPPTTLTEDIDNANAEALRICKINPQFAFLPSESDNLIYICWVKLWAMTFSYQDKSEKELRFQQLLLVLKKITYFESEALLLLFYALLKHDDDNMVIRFYEFLMVNKIKISPLLTDKLISYLNNCKHSCVEPLTISQDVLETPTSLERTFHTLQEYNILRNEVTFYYQEPCMECQQTIDLKHLCENFGLLDKEPMWVTCNSCHSTLLPKLGVRVGTEINSTNSLKFNTSSAERIILHSPYFLNFNFNAGLVKEFRSQFDVNNFRKKFSPLYWNSIWYFHLKKLPFDFFMCYEGQQLKVCYEEYINTKFKTNEDFNKYSAICQTNNDQILQGKQELSCGDKSKVNFHRSTMFETKKLRPTLNQFSKHSIIQSTSDLCFEGFTNSINESKYFESNSVVTDLILDEKLEESKEKEKQMQMVSTQETQTNYTKILETNGNYTIEDDTQTDNK